MGEEATTIHSSTPCWGLGDAVTMRERRARANVLPWQKHTLAGTQACRHMGVKARHHLPPLPLKQLRWRKQLPNKMIDCCATPQVNKMSNSSTPRER